MKLRSLPALACALFFAGLVALPAAGTAEERPLRQWLKERALQRERQKAGADTGIEGRLTKPGDYSFTIGHGGLTRMYRLHVPSAFDPARPAPLLVALHGGGGNMDHMADDANYGLITLADRAGIVVVFPNGFSKLKSGKFATWNAGDCCAGARDENVDDVGFIRQVVGNVARQIDIDRNRVFATGMSNGAMMAYRLACEMSDVFRAIAPVAGTDNTRGCAPSTPVSVLHIHAKNDTHVLFTGGVGKGVPDAAKVTDFTSVPDTVARWVRLNGCAAAPRRRVDKAGAYCEVHAQCRGGVEVELCVTEAGGHSWPGAGKTRGEPASQAISANAVMWDFFNRR